MDAKDLVVNYCRDGEVVEYLGEGAPDVERAVLADALIVEAVDLRDEAGLVVAPEEGDPVLVADLEGEQHEEGFDAVPAAVDVVPEEDVVGVGRVAADLEQLQQVVELPVDVPADGHRRPHLNSVRLSLQDLLGQLTQLLDGGLLDLLTLLQLLDYLLSQLPRTH